MDDDFERMMAALWDGTGYVELNVEGHHVSPNMTLAAQFAHERAESVSRGERVAFLYTHEHNATLAPQPPQWALSIGVSAEQARQLLTAGAKWIGSEHERSA